VLDILGIIGKEAKDALPEITIALRSKDESIQRRAIYVAGRIGKSSFPILLELLKEKDLSYSTKFQIAEAMGDIGTEAKLSIPILIEFLKSLKKDDLSRITIAEAIEKITKDKTSIPVLIELLSYIVKDDDNNDISIKNNNIYKKLTVIKAIKKAGESRLAASLVLEILRNSSSNEQLIYYKFMELAEIGGESPEFAPLLVTLLQSSQSPVNRSSIALVLAALNQKAKVAVPSLNQILKNETDPLLLTNASLALILIGADTQLIPHTIALTIDNLKTSDWYKIYAIKEPLRFVVKSLKGQMRSQVPSLIATLKSINVKFSLIDKYEIDKRVEFQKLLIRLIAEMDSDAEQAVPTLMEIAKDKQSKNRYIAIEALGSIGREAKTAIPLLKQILSETISIENKINIVKSLASLGETDFAVSFLTELCFQEDKKPYVYPYKYVRDINPSNPLPLDRPLLVPRKLGQLPPPLPSSRTPFPYYRNFNDDLFYTSLGYKYTSKGLFFYNAAEAFHQIGVSAIPTLIKDIKQTNPRRKNIAVFGLSEIQPLPLEVISLLKTIVDDETSDLDTRRLASYALERNNVDIEKFFNQYKIVASKKAKCLSSKDLLILYKGQCLVQPPPPPIPKNGGGSLFEAIKKILFPTSGK